MYINGIVDWPSSFRQSFKLVSKSPFMVKSLLQGNLTNLVQASSL